MPYWLESDTFADDPIWEVLAGGNANKIDALQAAYARLKAKASHLTTDGYLTKQTALDYCRGRAPVLDTLCTAALEREPLVHRRGDECSCLGENWIDGYDYRIHAFLRRNPSRTEYNRNRAQKADLRDARLKRMVYDRDGGCCRYCGSGPLSSKANRSRDRRKVLVYDHTDPDQPAGPAGENFVVSCGVCNEYKGRRTPYEADMILRPVPTPAERVALSQRVAELHDRPVYTAADLAAHYAITNNGSTTKQRNDGDPITETITDRDGDPDGATIPAAAPQPGHETADQQAEQAQPRSGNPLGSGRGGDADADPQQPPGRAQPTRSAAAPDIYTRRSRAAPPICKHCHTAIDPKIARRLHPGCEDAYEQAWERILARSPGGATAAGGGS